ncbi:uncharacterized protein LOC135838626 isoform X2 [Planococcus citri]|uniref:uncharacterized protein LOC135838626 isoform X2 n=1 Tax=Planococcus citri TaxID=170843 RepID=UPI0031F7798B
MDDTTSRVYDLTFPSPVTLKEISAIALVAELWREEIAHRTEIKTVKSRKIPILDLAWNIPLEKMMPLVPSKLYDLLDEYHHKFELSIVLWLQHHFINVVFDSDYDGYIGSLNNFHDFVWDQNGTIHYVRTAKRMMLSDRLPAYEKFRIAYMYCLEDDIRRIWPSVRWRMTGINFQDTPLLYYWICRIINELHSIPNPRDVPIDEFMLSNCSGGGFYSVEYFWNRTPYERRSQATIAMSSFDPGLFARFILPRLNDFELRSLLAERGAAFMTSLMENVGKNYANALPAWMYIRNQMNVSQFIQLIQILLSHETNYFIIEERSNSKAKVNLCCEIWKSSPENLKLSALKNNRIFSNKDVFRRIKAEPSEPREMRFLITILLDANFEQRHKFWTKTM